MPINEGEHPADALRRLKDEITATPGWEVLTRIRRLERTLAILLGNSADLRAALEFFADPRRSLPLWSVDRRAEFRQFLGDVDRLLHNFLASAKTLVDHSRRIMTEAYEGSPVMERYIDEAQRLFADGPPVFVQDLRNYFLHYDLARSMGRMHQSADEFRAEVLLDRDRLLAWGGWKATAKSWLESQPPQLDLRAQLDDYEARVRELYDWVGVTLREEHAAEVAHVELLVKEHDELVHQIAPEL